MQRNFNASAEEQIYNDNKNLIHAALKRFYKNETKYLCYEDLFQEGSLGLLKAIRTFDDSKNTTFSSYAMICIRNEIRLYIMRNKFGGVKVGKNTQYAAIKEGKDAVDELVKKYSVQLSGAPNFPEGFLSERSKSPSAEDEALLRIYIEETIESIRSEKYRAVLRRYFETMNAIQVADELGVSKDTVYDAINKFKEKYIGDER